MLIKRLGLENRPQGQLHRNIFYKNALKMSMLGRKTKPLQESLN